MSQLTEKKLKPNAVLDSGQVRQFVLPDGKTRITQITTFCPDVIGPGPTNLYLIDDDALILLDTGIPTQLAKDFFYVWRNQPMPPDVQKLRPDHSEQEFVEGLEIAGYSPRDIDLLVISHGHLDHFLMGDTIVNMGNPRVAAHVVDTPDICNPWGLIHMWLSRHHILPATGMPGTANVRDRAMEYLGKKSVTESLHFSLQVDVPIIRD
ncbi:MAG: MBL fold metallo-hydrolase, partial [Deltaproteobacteria bacterium]